MSGRKITNDTAHFVDVYLTSNTNYEAQAAVTYSEVEFKYEKNVDPPVAYADWALSANNFYEVGSGFYKVKAAATLFDEYGDFHYTVHGTGFNNYNDTYTVAHKEEYQTDLQVPMAAGSFSDDFTGAWMMKVIGSLHFANYAEISRSFGADGLESATIRCYDFTGTQNAEDADTSNTIAVITLSVGYESGVRTRLSGVMADPVYEL